MGAVLSSFAVCAFAITAITASTPAGASGYQK
jgi:hypothetical protein